MANKKVEEKNMKNKKSGVKSVSAKKKEKVVEAVVEEEMVTCEECGKKYLASLNECPKCGYSPVTSKKTFYDDEDDFEDYDDEDEEYVEEKVEVKPVKEEVKKTSKKEEKVETKKEVKKDNKKKEKKSSKDLYNKKVSVDSKKSLLSDDSNDILSFIKIIIVIILLVAIVWLIAAFVNKEFDKEDKTDDKDEVAATIQNSEILGTSIFNKADKEYYVLVYDASEDNHWAKYYALLYSDYSYIKDDKKLPMFFVDLSDPLNADIVAENEEAVNTKPSKYEDLSVSSPALIRIKNGKLDKYYHDDYAVDKLTRLIEAFQEKEEDK